MAHCGYEPTAADATLRQPLQALRAWLRGPRTDGEMAPEISLDQQRPAQFVFSDQVQRKLSEIRTAEAQERANEATASARLPMEAAE
jgi:hypothetical protein